MRLPWRRGERDSSLDLLVVGLGNPGRSYAGHRHNVGWMVVDELARRHGATWKGKFHGQLAELRIDGHRVALLKPETFDEIDLEHGRLQARQGGGFAGHNGLRSIAAGLKTPDFLRLRIGVGRPGRGDPRKPADYVLSNFAPDDDAESLVARAADAVEKLDAEGLEQAQAQYN